MPIHYFKKGFEILEEEGIIELSKSVNRFTQTRIVRHTPLTYGQFFSLNTFKNRQINRIVNNAPANPYKTIKINANDILFTNRAVRSHVCGLGLVSGGSWDSDGNLIHVDDYWIVKGLKQRYQDGYDWEETAYVETAKKRFFQKSAREVKGARNIDQFINERCRYVDRLYEEINNGGYRPASDDKHNQNEKYRGYFKDWLEVLTVIDRNGEIHLQGGHHRFAIAQILDLKIPVHILCRHKRWQELREEIHDVGLSESHGKEIRDHPDLQDVLNCEQFSSMATTK